MGGQSLVNAEHQRRYAEAIRQARAGGMHAFQSWFNEAKDINQSIVRGYWDLAFHILTPKVCEHIDNPEKRVALEIGYGGGRILNAACSYFREVIGVDIHDEQGTVKKFLRAENKRNFRLVKTSASTIDVEPESIDFVYSFITLQHLPSFDVFVGYIKEIHRCLKRGGVAQLYFGSYSKLSRVDQLRYFIQGYKAIPEAPVNHTSLVIRVSKVKKVCKAAGFRVVDVGTSFKRAPDGYPKVRGGQTYVTLLKEPQLIRARQ